jgi:hypothetical protein
MHFTSEVLRHSPRLPVSDTEGADRASPLSALSRVGALRPVLKRRSVDDRGDGTGTRHCPYGPLVVSLCAMRNPYP